MSFTAEQLQSVMVGSQENRIEGLRQLLAYPLKQRDSEGSRYWYLPPGADEGEAQDTCPIAVGFYSELNQSTDGEVKQFLTADEQQNEIYGHYTPLGLADPEVMILDPACGTGTFLLWIFQLIYQQFQENPDALTQGLEDRSWSGYVKERLLPRVFGFELLMAPYAIAHLKLGLFPEETGYE